MSSAGDLADLPDGTTALLENRLIRPGRFPKRPPTTYDVLDNIVGLANFDDPTNKVNRLVAIDSARKLYEKGTSGETWSASIGTIAAGVRLSSSTYYRGVLYGMLADSNGLPAQAFSFDGTNLSSAPFDSVIAARTITTLNDRNFLGYPRVTVSPLSSVHSNVITTAYDWTNTTYYVPTNLTAYNITLASGVTVCRLVPSSLATSGCSLIFNDQVIAGVYNGLAPFPASTLPQYILWSFEASGVDPTYEVPFTIELVYLKSKLSSTAYAVGDMVTDGLSLTNGYRYRCTVAGTTGVAVALGTTIGGNTVDGTVTWKNEGSDIAAATEGLVPSQSENGSFSRWWVLATIPPTTNGGFVRPRLKLYNTQYPALTTLAPIDISVRDGLADGDVRKSNHGQQFTAGNFYFPFFNCETATTATIDMKAWVWSEILQPKTTRASNTFQPQEFTGDPTASCAIDKRLVGFYRNGFVQWNGTSDPDIPIREEKVNTATGCLGPLAHDEHNNETFFISEDDCYRYRAGQDSPTPFCGDGMREEIMARGSTWVESQATYKRPLLTIDQYRLLVYVYTQKSLLYVYDLRANSWSRFTLPNGTELDCMAWNRNTQNVYLSLGGHGLVRLDYSVTAQDAIDNAGALYPITANIVYRPIELQSPQRYDTTIESIQVYDSATADQTGQTVSASYSYDQGRTFSNSVTAQMTPGAGEFRPVYLPGWESAATITVKHSHTGKGGEAASCLSPRGVATLLVRRGEYPSARPSAVSSTL